LRATSPANSSAARPLLLTDTIEQSEIAQAMVGPHEVHLPLFPGYLFCRLDMNRRLPVLITPGVMHIVGIGKAPHPVEENEIRALQAIVLLGLQTEPRSYLNIGEKVRIEVGPLGRSREHPDGAKGIAEARRFCANSC
jgi:transcription antitermination factor NusG